MNETKTKLAGRIENEISDYLNNVVNISENYQYSQPKLVRRISLFENKLYVTGKFDKQGNYKYWFDITTPCVNSEIKNIDFDTKDIQVFSERMTDELPLIILNLDIKRWLRENGQAEEINASVEEGAAWGNVVWKKVKGAYERADLKNFYVINQTAYSLDESPVIERHEFTQTDLRAKSGVWMNVDEAIKECATNLYSETAESVARETTTPHYYVYERNGEISVAELKEVNGQKVLEGDDKNYVLAKVIAIGTPGQGSAIEIKYVLFANKISSMPYKEYHRSVYKGRWFREGLIELLFDHQVRANEIGNQIARGLEWASKTIFRSKDKLIVQNIMTEMKNGDVVIASDLGQVPVRMEGLDQLIADWNRIVQSARDLSNATEIVTGDSQPSGVPFRLAALLNQNANKIFDFLREKLAIPMTEIFQEWIIPSLIKELSVKEVYLLLGDSQAVARVAKMVVDSWYIDNLINIGPHTPEIGDTIKAQKLQEFMQKPQVLLSGLKQAFSDLSKFAYVVITGENSNSTTRQQTLASFIQLEQDPVRRSALIEMAMRMQGIDVGALPKTPPVQPAPTNPVLPPGAPTRTPQPIPAKVGA